MHVTVQDREGNVVEIGTKVLRRPRETIYAYGGYYIGRLDPNAITGSFNFPSSKNLMYF